MMEQNPNDVESDIIPPGCGLFFAWLIASILGTTMGWLLGWRLSFFIPGKLSAAGLGLILGIVLGTAQWVVLRGNFRESYWWIFATGIGWAVGFSAGTWLAQEFGLSEIGFGLVTGLVSGACCGAAQWFFLRRRATQAGWWLPASIFAWVSSLIFYQPGVSWIGALYGALTGIVTGVALVWLVYRPGEE